MVDTPHSLPSTSSFAGHICTATCEHTEEPLPTSCPSSSLSTPEQYLRHEEQSDNKPHACEQCDGRFKTGWQLRRHGQTKHGATKAFVCPALGCFDHQKPKAFARRDKLHPHMRSRHDARTLGTCEEASCELPAAELVILAIHSARTHVYKNHAVRNVYMSARRQCQLADCRRDLVYTTEKYLEHLEQEHVRTSTDDKAALAAEGYVVELHDGTGTAFLVCPLPDCQEYLNSSEDFTSHILDAHILAFRWRDQNEIEHYKSSDRRNNLWLNAPWLLKGHEYSSTLVKCRASDEHQVIARSLGIAIDWEGFLAFLIEKYAADQVQTMLPHSLRILRIWPQFAHHAVFSDLNAVRLATMPGALPIEGLGPEKPSQDNNHMRHLQASQRGLFV